MLLVAGLNQLPKLFVLIGNDGGLSLGRRFSFSEGLMNFLRAHFKLVSRSSQKHLSFFFGELFVFLTHAFPSAASDIWSHALDEELGIDDVQDIVNNRLMILFLSYARPTICEKSCLPNLRIRVLNS